jgi:hypothetical protein
MGFEEKTEEFVRNLEKNTTSSSLKKEAERSARAIRTSGKSTSATATAMATGMKKIEKEDNEEEEDELGMETRNWRKINLSLTVVLYGQDGKGIRGSDRLHEGTNNS